MVRKNTDLYPNLGLDDIIKILEKKDRKRLAYASYPLDGVKVLADLSYKNDGDLYHDFDIYYGKVSRKPLPSLLYFHGGGLVYGSKEISKEFCISLAKRGFNVVNINYRLLPDVTLKDQIKDVLDGIVYVYENSSRLNLNPDKIFLASDSAGSFLSLAALALMKDKNFRDVFSLTGKDIKISGMGFISPMTGLVKTGSLALINKPARRGLSDEQITFTDNILKALVNATLPPSLVVTSEEDFIRNQAFNIKNFLDEKAIKNKFLDFKKIADHPLGHGFAVSHPRLDESIIVLDEISNFFKKF